MEGEGWSTRYETHCARNFTCCIRPRQFLRIRTGRQTGRRRWKRDKTSLMRALHWYRLEKLRYNGVPLAGEFSTISPPRLGLGPILSLVRVYSYRYSVALGLTTPSVQGQSLST